MILYKYYAPNNNAFKSIINCGLWCDKYINMNDPFECLALLERKYSKKEIEQFKELANKGNTKEFKQLAMLGDDVITEFMNSIRTEFLENSYFFSSLSETYDNILLWSHYGVSHTGFVIAIEVDENDSHVNKVEYRNDLPEFDINWFFSIKEDDETNSPEILYLLRDFAIKSKHWEYENEWRINRKDKGYYKYLPENVKAIYFGLNCDPEIEKVVLFLSAGVNDKIPVYKMSLTKEPLGMKKKDYELP